jgi:hypothetical protein
MLGVNRKLDRMGIEVRKTLVWSMRRVRMLVLTVAGVAVAACQGPAPVPLLPGDGVGRSDRPGHVFVINLENKGYDTVWGAGSDAPLPG